MRSFGTGCPLRYFATALRAQLTDSEVKGYLLKSKFAEDSRCCFSSEGLLFMGLIHRWLMPAEQSHYVIAELLARWTFIVPPVPLSLVLFIAF